MTEQPEMNTSVIQGGHRTALDFVQIQIQNSQIQIQNSQLQQKLIHLK